MNFFNDCKDIECAKILFKKLALQHHPDRGGDTEIMQKINSDYAFICAKLIRDKGMNTEEAQTEFDLSEKYQSIINSIIGLDSINIELVGLWIWVTGSTYQHKDKLKEAGMYYASKKTAWYYRPQELKCSNRKSMSLDEIKSKYGSKSIKHNLKHQLN
jgi:curved DNA-binding protein CbpA